MRLSRALAVIAFSFAVAGCGYIHFGRLPMRTDPALEQAFMDLTIQQKVLKQELALARKEADALRSALERAGGTAGVPNSDLARQLEEASRELAALRVSHAKLQAEHAGPVADVGNVAALQDENSRLRRELDTARSENANLAEKLKTSLAEIDQAHTALTQLNADLLAQKEARDRAEQATTALRAQLQAVMARAGRAEDTPRAAPPAASPPAEPAQTAAAPLSALSALREAKAPPSESAPTAEIRTNLARARSAASATSEPTASAPPAASSPTASATTSVAATEPPPPSPSATPRTYTVQVGDTLEKISIRVYGVADQWSKIYDANSELLSSGQGLKAGATLRIP